MDLLDARAQVKADTLDAAGLRAVEDKASAEVVKFQEDLGLQVVGDGQCHAPRTAPITTQLAT